MDVLNIVLIALVVAGIWLVVEVAVTVRRARPVLDSVKKTAEDAQPVLANISEVADQAKPVIAHLDEVVSDARPAANQLDPLLAKATETLGELSRDLRSVDAILTDVSRISDTAGTATTAVSSAAASIASRAKALVFGRGHGAAKSAPASLSAPSVRQEPEAAPDADEAQGDAPSEEAAEPQSAPAVVNTDTGYFTYPSEPAENGKASA